MPDDMQDSEAEPAEAEPAEADPEVEGHGSNLNSSRSNIYRAPGNLGLGPPVLKPAEEPRPRADRYE